MQVTSKIMDDLSITTSDDNSEFVSLLNSPGAFAESFQSKHGSGVTTCADNLPAFIENMGCRLMLRAQEEGIFVPYAKIWKLHDLRQTTAWKDKDTAAKFQHYLRKKQQTEKKEAIERRHATRTRRTDLLKEQNVQSGMGFLIDRVADIFALGLLNELRQMHGVGLSAGGADDSWEILGEQQRPKQQIGGLFAKWAPTPGGMHDKALGICPIIRDKLVQMLNDDVNREVKLELLRSVANRVGKVSIPLEQLSLQRDFLTPLRTYAEVPEHFIGPGAIQGNVNYSRMASRCRMIFGEKVFRRYDEENYDRFLVEAAKSCLRKKLEADVGKHPKVNVGALSPHEIMSRAVSATSPVKKVEAALQWQAMVDSCRQIANKNGDGYHKRLIIPMCDVSGSMCSTCGDFDGVRCMDVACALSLLLTDSLPDDHPFYGKVLTFSANPNFVDLRLEEQTPLSIESIESANSLLELSSLVPDLASRVRDLQGSDWGMNTDFFKAMECICEIATERKMTFDDVRGLELVVFSDMEFDQAQYGNFDKMTMLEKIRELFIDRFGPEAKDYPPKIVYWNLRASTSGSGVVGNALEDCVALLSGVSAGMIKGYLGWNLDSPNDKETTKVNPMSAMLACLENSLYGKLRLEKDLQDWEILVSEEEIMKRGEKIAGENGEWIHSSNESALVAFFFEVVPGVEQMRFEELLEGAFKENPMLALKLLFQLGCVRRKASGKSDRENFQRGLLWLWRKWPETYVLNIECIAKFTSLKELLNSTMFILYDNKSTRDPGDYALFSLEGQKTELNNYIAQKKFRDKRARRKSQKYRRLEQWLEFARSEGKVLFGDLRIVVDWDEFKEKITES